MNKDGRKGERIFHDILRYHHDIHRRDNIVDIMKTNIRKKTLRKEVDWRECAKRMSKDYAGC